MAEAAANYYLLVIKEHRLTVGDTFLMWIAEVKRHKYKAIFLVGGFSESPYLIKRVKERFQGRIPVIAFLRDPMVASVKGAVAYGLNMKLIESRVNATDIFSIHFTIKF
ncbi:hypothetical protein C2G38_2272027 [Gigaspora rosea]|uniref:Uncharacterized protein n=1 Tax=Gigaspora rosea TaxID=44941 RepID=A0A397VTP2_9GLOM|nr:hypothetical protein C2G38_2272027 [Gigaspora rosea]